jgi:phosphoribosylformylglycinamidine synthase
LLHFYRLVDKSFEYCFNIEASEKLSQRELKILKWLLAETFEKESFRNSPLISSYLSSAQHKIIEIGPRLNFETAYSSNAVAICRACGLEKITRLERSRRYLLSPEIDRDKFINENHDRMTECLYPEPLKTFETGIIPQKVYHINLFEGGMEALEKLNKTAGLGFDPWDIEFYYNLFVLDFGRNPTNVECFQLSQANSEHSRHWFFKGKFFIDGKQTDNTLIYIIKSTLDKNPSNSLIAFKDNSSAINGYEIWTIIPVSPGCCSPFTKKQCKYHIIFTAETHNFPSGVAPFPGAETGTGGRIRDIQATGRGGLVVAGTAGYATGNLNIPDYLIPGEEGGFSYPSNLSTPLKIMIEESNGASDYGNKFGEPVIQGFTRTFGLKLSNGERKEWIKPIMFTGGVGQIDDNHIYKRKPEKDMLIIQVGGPAYRIGLGGGSASSLIQGENRQDLDFNAVQRGNAEMEQKLNRVIRACIEMGDKNPILSIHDQGAGGPCNVLTEIVNPAGGRIEIRKIAVGDKTMSVLEIWVAEYQERNAFLIYASKLEMFTQICQREKINCEVLGKITGDGRIVVYDSWDNTTPVDLNLSKILGNIPQKVFKLERLESKLKHLKIPEDLSIEKAIENVFKLPSVGSKGFLVRKVDRSVTGLIARQQCCGPLQLPVSDVSVVAQSHFGLTGAAISIGEQPSKILINPAAGAKMAVGESLTNIVWALISDLNHVKCSVNWMWPAKLLGEGAALWDAANSLADLMIELGIAADGGKDSVSMAAQVGDEIVKAPGEVVVSSYCTMPDINKVVTPDIKRPGKSKLIFIDIASGKNRLGGSALAQVLKQIGNQSPDVDNPVMLKNAFRAIQQLISRNFILAGHDRSDGGLVTTIAEMIMSGNCGAEISLLEDRENKGIIPQLFSEELGLVFEYAPESENEIIEVLNDCNLSYSIIGDTLQEKHLVIKSSDKIITEISTTRLIEWWESTSDELEKHQMSPVFAQQQKKTHNRKGPEYHLTFNPEPTQSEIISRKVKPKVAIIRDEGSNGDREMTSAFFMSGFETWDVTMTDLLKGSISLDAFRGAVFVGGFSYADVLDSAKGWAGIIKFNTQLAQMFENFYKRNNTFSLGVCNGCQLMSLLGWIPWYGIPEEKQPRFISNPSGRFESRWVTVKILESPAIMFNGMEGSVLGIWVAHREGYLHCPDKKILKEACNLGLTPLVYIDDEGNPTEIYPFNPNSSPDGITAICSRDGRHLAMMPHPERAFLLWQWPWIPQSWKTKLKVAPWLKMFQNARKWCEEG